MNLQEENEVLEKNKDDYELLGITWGKYYQKKRKLNRFFKYLKRNYFRTDKGYNRKNFDYHSQLLNGDNTLSTNPIENQNHQLKNAMGARRLPFHKLGRKLNEYHSEHVGPTLWVLIFQM